MMVLNLGETGAESHPEKVESGAYRTQIKPTTSVFLGFFIILSALE